MPHRDPAERKAYHHAKYLKNRDKVRERVREYQIAHSEEIAARQHKKYLRNKDAISIAAKENRARNAEEIRAKDRANYAKNAERKREIDRLRYLRDQEKIKRRANSYRQNNPDKRSDAQQRRRALKKGAVVERVLRPDILSRDGPLCALCAVETTIPVYATPTPTDRHYDHVVPLARGGTHSMNNMRILCAPCNTSKKTRLDSELSPSFVINRKKKHDAQSHFANDPGLGDHCSVVRPGSCATAIGKPA